MTDPCLDCAAPLPALTSPDYPPDALFSKCYLCPFCRKHRYTSEAHALARCRAGLPKRFPERYGPKAVQ